MIRWLIANRLNALERRLGASVDYLRHLASLSPVAFIKFILALPAATHRTAAPSRMMNAVRLITTQSEDCGSCVQIAINAALKEGVPDDLVQAILNGRFDRTPTDVALACGFARSVVSRDGDDERWRRRLSDAHGDAVVVELSLAIATARLFPTLRRGMGFANHCTRPSSAQAGSRSVNAAFPP